jgi:hypothetical protein
MSLGERGAYMGDFVKRAIDSRKGNKQAARPADEEFAVTYPALWDFLTCDKHSDGKARARSTLTVFCEASTFKASLNDRDQGCSGFASGDTFTAVLGALDQALQDGTLDWRFWDRNGKGKPK